MLILRLNDKRTSVAVFIATIVDLKKLESVDIAYSDGSLRLKGSSRECAKSKV